MGFRFNARRNVIVPYSSGWTGYGNSGGGAKDARRLTRQLFHLGEWRIGRAGAEFGAIFNHPIEPPIEKENRAFARLTIAAVGFAHRVTQAKPVTEARPMEARETAMSAGSVRN